MDSDKKFIHTKYCSDIRKLSNFLDKLHSSELITVTEQVGYTVIWKSEKEHDWRGA